jgi:hypothetical protein
MPEKYPRLPSHGTRIMIPGVGLEDLVEVLGSFIMALFTRNTRVKARG